MPNFYKLSAAIIFLSLAACNTTSGLGQDLESAGDAISNTADDASD